MNAVHAGVVWNPAKTTQDDLAAALEEAGVARISWFETSKDDPGQEATQQALDAEVDVILVAGGDGTVRAVAERLAGAGARIELGILPAGTGNLLARNLDIPLDDLPAAVARALDGTARPIDIGWVAVPSGTDVERHAFAVMAGFGIDAHMITETDDELKDKAGWLAYVESLGRAVSASDVIDVRLSRDGGDPRPERAHTVIVGNCGTLQGGITLLPDADPSDGELDLLVLHADGVAGWVDTMRNVVWDNGLKRVLSGGEDDGVSAQDSETTTRRRLTELTIELDEPRVVEVDGDALAETTRLDITVQPAAIRVR